MAVQDLTPQLRTRLSRLERVVGWFVMIATFLLLAGLGYYIYSLAEQKGWFLAKAHYFTYLRSGAGIKIGGAVRLMGFDAGKITDVKPEKPGAEYNVYVEFVVHEPNYGYVWDDSVVHVKSAGFLGDRYLEVTKGGTLRATNLHATYLDEPGHKLAKVYVPHVGYTNWDKGSHPYFIEADEPPELSSQLDDVVRTVKISLTNILALTNALTQTLTNAAEATGHLKELLAGAKPLATNLAAITEHLKEPRGALGEWLFPTNMNVQIVTLLTNLNTTVANANHTVTNANTNLVTVFSNVTVNLENLAKITSNLNAQVQANTNIVSSVSDLIVHSDDLVQGLKRHWLLRSAFKKKDEKAKDGRQPAEAPQSLRPKAPKGAGRE